MEKLQTLNPLHPLKPEYFNIILLVIKELEEKEIKNIITVSEKKLLYKNKDFLEKYILEKDKLVLLVSRVSLLQSL